MEIFQEGVRTLSNAGFGVKVLTGDYEQAIEMYKTSSSVKKRIPRKGNDVTLDMDNGRLSAAHGKLNTLPYHVIDKHWQWVTSLDMSNNQVE